jgi:type I restriction enzyme, S subunit
MVGEWIDKAIGDIADIVGGSTPYTKDHANFDGDIPWLTPKDLSRPHPRYITRGERNLSKKGLESCSSKLLPTNSVLLTTRAPVGYLAIAANPISTNQGFRNLVVRPDFDHEFIYYWLLANVDELERHASGSTFKELSGTSLKKIRMRLPSDYGEQCAISHIFSKLDDKIELNQAINGILESIAQVLFRSWFVDFDPVKAGLAARRHGRDPERAAMAVISGKLSIPPGKPKPETLDDQLPSPEALDAAVAGLDELSEEQRNSLARTASLFPDDFEESELGLIPNSWKQGTLSDIAINVRDGVKPQDMQPDLPYVGLEHIQKKCFSLYDWGKSQDVESNKSKFQESDFLFGKLRPYFHKVCRPGFNGICSTDVLVVRAVTPEYAGIVGCLLFQEELVEYANARSSGTRMPRASWKDMAEFTFPIPGESLASQFSSLVVGFWKSNSERIQECLTLANLRDTLLPKLLSGEIRIPEPEQREEQASA